MTAWDCWIWIFYSWIIHELFLAIIIIGSFLVCQNDENIAFSPSSFPEFPLVLNSGVNIMFKKKKGRNKKGYHYLLVTTWFNKLGSEY